MPNKNNIEMLEKVKSSIANSKGFFVVDYRGLTVAQDTELRRNIRKENLTYKVYKNTMVKLAIKDTEWSELEKDLEGPTAVVVSKEDATAAARVVADFAKKNPALELKSGVVEGNYYDQNGIKVIATIPSREALLSRLLGSLQSPISNLARVLNQLSEKKAEA